MLPYIFLAVLELLNVQAVTHGLGSNRPVCTVCCNGKLQESMLICLWTRWG